MAHVFTRSRLKLDPELKDQFMSMTMAESQVVIHCNFHSLSGGDRIRVWPTTYLFDVHSDHTSSLIHVENMKKFPFWTDAVAGDNNFTLIFSGLPKACKVFDMIEDCDGAAGSFRVTSIQRTQSDVYYVQL